MLQRLGFPSVGQHRRFVTAIAVDAVGSGVFMPVSMLYFLAVTPTCPSCEVGAAISLASLVALPAGPLIGALVDRFGAKRILLVGNALQRVGFVAYLFAESFVGGPALDGRRHGRPHRVLGLLRQHRRRDLAAGGAGAVVRLPRGACATSASRWAAWPRGSRSRSAPTLAFHVVVAVNAVSYVVAFLLLLAVPATGDAASHETLPGTWATVLRDRPYRLLSWPSSATRCR